MEIKKKINKKLWMLVLMLKNYLAVIVGIHAGRYFSDMDNFTWPLTSNELTLLLGVFVVMELIDIKNQLIDKE